MALSLLLREFKKKCEANVIFDYIIDYTRKENEFSIYIYCLQKDINFEKEKKRLIKLYYKHGLCYNTRYWGPTWELPKEKKITSKKPTCFSTYVFSFKKRELILFFFNLLIFFFP